MQIKQNLIPVEQQTTISFNVNIIMICFLFRNIKEAMYEQHPWFTLPILLGKHTLKKYPLWGCIKFDSNYWLVQDITFVERYHKFCKQLKRVKERHGKTLMQLQNKIIKNINETPTYYIFFTAWSWEKIPVARKKIQYSGKHLWFLVWKPFKTSFYIFSLWSRQQGVWEVASFIMLVTFLAHKKRDHIHVAFLVIFELAKFLRTSLEKQ